MREDSDIDSFGCLDQPVHRVGGPETPGTALGVADEDLRDSLFAGKLDDLTHGVRALQNVDLGAQFAGQVEVPMESLLGVARQIASVSRKPPSGAHENGRPNSGRIAAWRELHCAASCRSGCVPECPRMPDAVGVHITLELRFHDFGCEQQSDFARDSKVAAR